MKFHVKTPSKNLGKLMRSGETAPAHHIPHDQKGKDTCAEPDNIAENRETRIGEELAQMDTDSFERILRNVAASKTDLLKNVQSGVDPTLISIMGLIDNVNGRSAETEHSNITSTKTPVKFDEVIDFIDDGAEEIVIEKPPTVAVKKFPQLINMKSPIRGNPVTDYDKINEMNGIDGENHMMKVDQDPISRMEMGQPAQTPREKTVDDVDLDKIRKSQRNMRCDEQEQLSYLQERGLREFSRFENILGPVSKGEFASFNQTMSPTVGCELGVLNPVSVSNYPVFQTCTPNGRLLPAIPRKFFSPNEAVQNPRIRPAPQKSPVTIMLQTTAPSLLTTTLTESCIPNFYSPPPISSMSPPILETTGTQIETPSQKKRAKIRAKKAAAAEASLNGVAEGEEMNTSVEEDEEKENKLNDGLTEEEREARRNKNRKNREKKKAKKAGEKKDMEQAKTTEIEHYQNVQTMDTSLNSAHGNQFNNRNAFNGIGSPSQDDSLKGNQNSGNGRRSNAGNAGAKKNNKNSVATAADLKYPDLYTEGVGSNSLEDILKEFGINDVSELNENPGKKNKKANNNNNNNSKKNNKQQKKEQQQQKEVARSPLSDNEIISVDESVEKNKKQQGGKKMDEVAVAASITKRCSSGVGQQSEEDDDQSYVSAQENLGGSNSRLSTPPTEFVDARQSRDDALDNVMLDPNNYRDDEDVESLAKQLQKEEDEFITVGKNKKKNKKQSSIQENASASSTASSSSPPNRRNTHPDARASSITGSNYTSSSLGNNQPHHNQQQRSSNRPVAHPTTLGDFIESTKKETHKNVKHKKMSGPVTSTSQKKQTSFDEPTPSSPAFVDALETPISVNTAPAFSYADAAKKSSGENTPAHEMSPVPPSANSSTASIKKLSSSSIPQTSETSAEKNKSPEPSSPQDSPTSTTTSFATAVSGGAVQLPPSTAAAAASDISFGYEETPEDKRKRQQRETKTTTPPPQKPQKPTRMNGVDLLKSFTNEDGTGNRKDGDLQEMPKNGVREANVLAAEILALWQTRWNDFTSTGSKPVVYKPSQKK